MAALDLSDNNLLDPITTHLNTVLHNLPTAVVTLLAGFVVIRILSWIISWSLNLFHISRGLKEVLVSIIDSILAVFLFVVVVQSLGLNNVAVVITAVAAGLGIALGNGFIPLATDVVSGIYLGRDRDFNIGDIVEAGEPGFDRVQGEVLSLDMRRTRIRDTDGRVHSFPNTVLERHAYILVTRRRDRTDLKK